MRSPHESDSIICAFRRYMAKLLLKLRIKSKCAYEIDSPKSGVFISHWLMQLVKRCEAVSVSFGSKRMGGGEGGPK